MSHPDDPSTSPFPDPSPDPGPSEDERSEDDVVLAGAGARLRQGTSALDAGTIEVAALRRRARRSGAVALVAVLVAGVAGAAALVAGPSGGGGGSDDARLGPRPDEVEEVLADLPPEPVDPTEVQLVSSVTTYDDCEALIDGLRRVGAAHVGSRGFGDGGTYGTFRAVGAAVNDADLPMTGYAGDGARSDAGAGSGGGGVTLGTNVQISGVDELDVVKAEGTLVYDLDGRGDLRLTDVARREVIGTVDVTPEAPAGEGSGEGELYPAPGSQVGQLLVEDGRVVVFGHDTEVSDPIAGDPSATRATTTYLTVTMVDATDPARPTVTDRVRVEGELVSARLVDGEVRLVTTSHMADLGFVLPTTPNSVPIALEQNRRTVASSLAADWIPDWQRSGEEPTPLVPCDRVHVPDTFAGVAMTSMVTFPMGSGRFEPAATSILAPGETLYAGPERVAISSGVWVDPIDRERLEFDDWQTAVHEFGFVAGAPPRYGGSGIVDGSTVGQFAFGELGDALAVVSSSGTPWSQDSSAVDLTVLRPDGSGGLARLAELADLADGAGSVTAVRFIEDRVLVSAGWTGNLTVVIDVTDPSSPRRAGALAVPGQVGYFHPLGERRALLVSSRSDEVGSGDDRQYRPWVVAHLLDVADADAPRLVATWERPWVSDQVAADHHAFTFWPDRTLAMWGIMDGQWRGGGDPPPNHAVVLAVDDGIGEVAVPEASKPPESGPPCPVVEVGADVRNLVGPGGVVLRCDDRGTTELTWPRFECYAVDDDTVARYAPGREGDGAWFACSPAPPPAVARVLVVDGTPILFTDQTLEALDPETFASTWVIHHPTRSFTVW